LREYSGPVHGEGLDARTRRLEAFSAETVGAVNELARAIDPDRIDTLDRWAHRIDRMRKQAARFLWASAGAAALSLGSVGVWLINRGEQHGIESQRILNLEDAIRRQEQDLREIRFELRKAAGIDAAPIGGGVRFGFTPNVRMLSALANPSKEALCTRF
jgi:hypothetical protein